MKYFLKLYEKVLLWSANPKAARYLSIVSFIDASFFPVSPMFMFLPMCYAKPKSTFWYATLATISSILGGLLGYLFGLFTLELIVEPFFHWMGYEILFHSAINWFHRWGFWAVLLGCFSPIPYKFFTIGAGVMHLDFGLFLLASTLGRFLRFFAVGLVIWWFGPKMEPILRKTLTKFSNGY